MPTKMHILTQILRKKRKSHKTTRKFHCGSYPHLEDAKLRNIPLICPFVRIFLRFLTLHILKRQSDIHNNIHFIVSPCHANHVHNHLWYARNFSIALCGTESFRNIHDTLHTQTLTFKVRDVGHPICHKNAVRIFGAAWVSRSEIGELLLQLRTPRNEWSQIANCQWHINLTYLCTTATYLPTTTTTTNTASDDDACCFFF